MADDNPPFISLSPIPDSAHIAVEYRVFKKQDDSYVVDRFLRAENHVTAMRNATAWAAVYHCEIRDITSPTRVFADTMASAPPWSGDERHPNAQRIIDAIETKPLDYWWRAEASELEGVIDTLTSALRDRPTSIQVAALGITVGMFLGELSTKAGLAFPVADHLAVLQAFQTKAIEWIRQNHQTSDTRT